MLCNSFSDVAFDFDAKMCKSFDKITSDIDRITNMIKITPKSKAPHVKSCGDTKSKSAYIAEPRLDLASQTKNSQARNEMAEGKTDKISELVSENKMNIKLLAGKLCSSEAKFEKGLSTCFERVGALERQWEKQIAKMNKRLDSTFEYMDTRVDSRMDLIFGEKSQQIDDHFTETFEVIDVKVAGKVNGILSVYNKENSLNFEKVQTDLKEV